MKHIVRTLLSLLLLLLSACGTLEVTLDRTPTPDLEATATVGALKAQNEQLATQIATLQPASLQTIAAPGTLAPTLGGDQLSPSWKPDGLQIVFINEDPKTSQRSLYLVDMVSGRLSRITDNPETNDILPQFSPDGKRVLFVSQWLHRGASSKKIPSTIMILDVSSGAISQLSDGSDYVYEAAWSPDGARIAFVSDRGGKDRLWVMNADGSDPRLLTPDLDRIRGPVWSPNGSFILVTDWSIDGAYAEIHVIDLQTGSDRRVTDPSENANQAAWSPDSRRLYYLSSSSLFAIAPDGTNRELVLKFPSPINDYSISPDGALIAYSMGGEGHLDLYMSGLDGSNRRCYRHPDMDDVFPVWSPDSGRFVFSSFVPHAGPVQQYLMRVEDMPSCIGYELLSSSKVKIPELDLTVEVSGRLTQSRLDINTDISVPVDFLTAVPITDMSIVQDVKISALSLPLTLEPDWGGGGSGVENGMFGASGTQTYLVKTPLTPGQKVQITVLVTFGERVPVKGAIPLTINLVVESD